MIARPLPPATRTMVGVALAAWLVVLTFTLLAPSDEGGSWLVATVARAADGIGVPPSLAAPARVEVLLNVAAFVPVSLLGSLLWSRPTWRDWTAGGFVVSFLVELVQAVALDGRTATHSDVVANTAGALAGAVLGGSLMRAASRAGSEDRADLPHRNSPAQQLDPPG